MAVQSVFLFSRCQMKWTEPCQSRDVVCDCTDRKSSRSAWENAQIFDLSLNFYHLRPKYRVSPESFPLIAEVSRGNFKRGSFTCADPEGGGRGSGPPLENHKYYGFLYKLACRPLRKKLDPPPGKCWTSSEALENYSFLWNKPLINRRKTVKKSWGL